MELLFIVNGYQGFSEVHLMAIQSFPKGFTADTYSLSRFIEINLTHHVIDFRFRKAIMD
jgi:hypothetical protein